MRTVLTAVLEACRPTDDGVAVAHRASWDASLRAALALNGGDIARDLVASPGLALLLWCCPSR